MCGLFDHLVTCIFFVLRSLLCRPLVIPFADFSGNPSRWWRRGRRAVAQTSKQIPCVCDWFPYLLFHCFTFLSCDTSLLHFIIAPISFTCIFRSLLISTRKQLPASTNNLEESKRRSFRALHGEFGFNFLFWVTGCIIHTYLFKKIIGLALTPIHPPSRCFS